MKNNSVLYEALSAKIDDKLKTKLEHPKTHGDIVLKVLLDFAAPTDLATITAAVGKTSYKTAGNPESLICGDLRGLVHRGLATTTHSTAKPAAAAASV